MTFIHVKGPYPSSILKVDSMLRCVCSVIDHSWCQIVVRTKEWHLKGSQMCHRCDRKSIGLYDKKKTKFGLWWYKKQSKCVYNSPCYIIFLWIYSFIIDWSFKRAEYHRTYKSLDISGWVWALVRSINRCWWTSSCNLLSQKWNCRLLGKIKEALFTLFSHEEKYLFFTRMKE